MIYKFIFKTPIQHFFIIISIITFLLNSLFTYLVFSDTEYNTISAYFVVGIVSTIESFIYSYLIIIIRETHDYD